MADDQLLADELPVRGIETPSPVWSDPAVDWGASDVVFVRSP